MEVAWLYYGAMSVARFWRRVAILAAAFPLAGIAQPEEKAVLAVVQQFFDVLASRDAAAARELFLPEARFVVVNESAGKRAVTGRSFAEFTEGLAKGKEKLLERMWSPEVRIRGGMASVWTPYDFHRDGKFSHCGVDAFHLVKTEGGWKIAGAMYTVEKQGCESRP